MRPDVGWSRQAPITVVACTRQDRSNRGPQFISLCCLRAISFNRSSSAIVYLIWRKFSCSREGLSSCKRGVYLACDVDHIPHKKPFSNANSERISRSAICEFKDEKSFTHCALRARNLARPMESGRTVLQESLAPTNRGAILARRRNSARRMK